MFENRQIIKPLCRKIKVQQKDEDLYNSYNDYAVMELCEILEKRILIDEQTDTSQKRICQKSSNYQFNFQPVLRTLEPNFEIVDQDDGKIENLNDHTNESISTCKIVIDNDYLNIFVNEVNFMEQTTIIKQRLVRKIKLLQNGGVKKRICKQKCSRNIQ